MLFVNLTPLHVCAWFHPNMSSTEKSLKSSWLMSRYSRMDICFLVCLFVFCLSFIYVCLSILVLFVCVFYSCILFSRFFQQKDTVACQIMISFPGPLRRYVYRLILYCLLCHHIYMLYFTCNTAFCLKHFPSYFFHRGQSHKRDIIRFAQDMSVATYNNQTRPFELREAGYLLWQVLAIMVQQNGVCPIFEQCAKKISPSLKRLCHFFSISYTALFPPLLIFFLFILRFIS